jgi:hypothetical protein
MKMDLRQLTLEDHVLYLADHGVLICRPCRHPIQPKGGQTHGAANRGAESSDRVCRWPNYRISQNSVNLRMRASAAATQSPKRTVRPMQNNPADAKALLLGGQGNPSEIA